MRLDTAAQGFGLLVLATGLTIALYMVLLGTDAEFEEGQGSSLAETQCTVISTRLIPETALDPDEGNPNIDILQVDVSPSTAVGESIRRIQ